MHTPPPLTSHIAIITGATRRIGIGAAICRALAAAGADIYFTSWPQYERTMPWGMNAAEPEELLNQLRDLGVRAGMGEFDLSDPNIAPQLFDAATDALGAPTILVNNAAHSTNDGWEALDAETLDAHYAVNLRATALLSVEFARRFEQPSGGRIINLTTGIALAPMPSELAYASTKAGVEAFTRSVAPDLMERGITINAVDPGPTDTGWMSAELHEALKPRFPTGLAGQPEDIARLVVFLASDDARWITGQIIHSEGGFRRF